jgi:hypothetical protein
VNRRLLALVNSDEVTVVIRLADEAEVEYRKYKATFHASPPSRASQRPAQ